MPEYLAPGVYVEETSFRAKSIEGVSTSTTGFVGPTRFGPVHGKPEVLTSFADFERIYGGLEDLFDRPNYLAHAARGYFDEGGRRLYVARVTDGTGAAASATVGTVTVAARYQGVAGEMQVDFELLVGRDVLTPGTTPALARVREGDSVAVLSASPPTLRLREARRDADGNWLLVGADGSQVGLAGTVEVRPVTVRVEVARPTVDARGLPSFGAKETLGTFPVSGAAADGLLRVLGDPAPSAAQALTTPIVVTVAPQGSTAADMEAFVDDVFGTDWQTAPGGLDALDPAPSRRLVLDNGSDGSEPGADDYRGTMDGTAPSGLLAFEAIEDISIVAGPGSSAMSEAPLIRNTVITHCELLRYRVAVLDTPRGLTVNEARDWRNQTSSTRAAIYYPWIETVSPFDGSTIALPPSGFVAGVWARNDVDHAVFKAPANEVVRSALDLEVRLSKGQQDVLNPEGVNCLRFFAGRGNLVWGARTMSDDPEWKYVSVRRYFAYLEHSIERGTQWAVFENNGEALWANVRRTVEDFLFNEWKMGALLGTDPKEAFFVRCDRTTMTQNDLDNGRLVCLIGVAVVKPAEFVIFRIGQWTASARN